jgi:hypothetical protein
MNTSLALLQTICAGGPGVKPDDIPPGKTPAHGPEGCELEGQSMVAIAHLAELHQELTRAILKALGGKMVADEVTAIGKLWRLQ